MDVLHFMLSFQERFWRRHVVSGLCLMNGQCAPGYCCPALSNPGCKVRATKQGNFPFVAACAAGRDSKVPLCGKCLEGLSEQLFGNTCMFVFARRDEKNIHALCHLLNPKYLYHTERSRENLFGIT